MIFYIFFYGFLAYLLYKLVFKFILPIYRTTKQVRRSFRDMQDQMNQHTNPYGNASRPEPQPGSTANKGDYIDFEEVKE
jgi:hypothetical protein